MPAPGPRMLEAVGLGLHGTLAPFAVTFGVAVPRRTAALALCGYLAASTGALAAR